MTTELLALLSDLVAFPSLTPDSAGSLEYIAQFMQQLGAEATWLKRNNTTNLIVSCGSGDAIFAFAGHVDVVPPGDIRLWQGAEPFKLLQDGERLIGRGVADMKGAIAAFLLALKRFLGQHHGASHKYRVLLLLTSDEEGSAEDGTKVIVEYLQQTKLRLNYCLVGEPSSVEVLGDTVKVGRRGSLTGELTVYGKQGHIAYPHLCINPIQQALPALAELSALSWDTGNQYFPATSLQLANINSGLGVTNVIPGYLTANFNFRYNNLHSAAELKQKTADVLDKYQLNYQISWNNSAEPFLTAAGELSNYISSAIEAVCQIKPRLATDGGTSDGRFLIAVSDEIIELGLINATIHQTNEATTVGDMQLLTEVYYNILCKVFNG